MVRDLYHNLLKWKNDRYRKPLVLKGARQVGKTYIINAFLKGNFKSFTSLNLFQNVDAIESIINSKNIEDFYLRYSLLCTYIIWNGAKMNSIYITFCLLFFVQIID